MKKATEIGGRNIIVIMSQDKSKKVHKTSLFTAYYSIKI